ncbi:unnamed protein product [Sphenostylis stenocarpa]|uniref:Uncharacterized protein n=1 Tax=Sphenostylis stenocarpa TaxID=92480 RepID=A0AA86W0P1_9FABA|nr:unnamed protein product [Sphenostylis stenocarpa]
MIRGGQRGASRGQALRWCATSLRVTDECLAQLGMNLAYSCRLGDLGGEKRIWWGATVVARERWRNCNNLRRLAMSRLVRWCRVSGSEGSGTVARWWCNHSGPEQRFIVTTGEA